MVVFDHLSQIGLVPFTEKLPQNLHHRLQGSILELAQSHKHLLQVLPQLAVGELLVGHDLNHSRPVELRLAGHCTH